MMDSSLDGMVQLLKLEYLRGPVTEVVGLRKLIYKREEDLLSLLNDEPQTIDNPPVEGSGAPSTSTLTNIFELLPVDEIDASESALDPDEADEEVAHDSSLDSEDEYFIPDTELPKDIPVAHSSEEIDAASKLQKLCRVAIERKTLSEGAGVEGAIYRYLQLCIEEKKEMTISYRLRFLCFVPPLLASLDTLQALALAKRSELAKRIGSGKIVHGQLDEVCSTLGRIRYVLKTHDTVEPTKYSYFIFCDCSVVLKAIKRIQQTLGPNSEFHHSSDVPELKKHLQEALSLFKDLCLPIEVPEPVRNKLEMICLGIMPSIREDGDRHGVTEKRSKRPILNWDDEEEEILNGDDLDEST